MKVYNFLYLWANAGRGSVWAASGFIGCFFAAAIAAFLDMSTFCPTAVWALVWFGLTLIFAAGPTAINLFPIHHLGHIRLTNVMRDYYALSRDERKSIPKASISVIRNKYVRLDNRLRVADAVLDLIGEIERNRYVLRSDNITEVLEEIDRERENIRVETETYKEFA